MKSLSILGFLFSWISGFTQSLKINIQRNTIFPLTLAYSACHHEFKNPRITAFCWNHEYWCKRTKVVSHYVELNTVGVYALEVLSYEINKIMVYEFGTLYKLIAFCAVFVDHRLSFGRFILSPFHCLSFCHLRILNTSYVSSDLSDKSISDNL